MSLKRLSSLRHSLALRLTLWYAGIFLLSAGIAFAFFYYLITSTIRGRTDQDLLAEVRSFSSVMLRQGIEAVKRQAVLESQAAGEKKIFIQLVYPDGRVFSSSNMSYFRNIPVATEAISRMLDQGEPLFATVSSPDRSHEIRVVYALLGPGLIVHLGQAMDDLTRIIDAFQKTFVAIMAVLFILAAVIGWFMARRALAGVENVTRTARRISGSSLTERVPVTGREDEIDQLAVTFNQMLDRIQTLVTGIKEMTDNIAHDLKSPITRIRGEAELTLLGSGSGSREEYEAVAASAIEECDRLIEMINTMLFISRTEAGVTQPELAQMDIAALVRDACRLFQAPAEEKGITLDGRGPERLALSGDIRLAPAHDREPAGQRHQIHPRQRPRGCRGPLPGRRPGGDRGAGHRPRHLRNRPAARLRALLPRGPQPLPDRGGPGSQLRPRRRARPRRGDHGRKLTGRRQHFHRDAARTPGPV